MDASAVWSEVAVAVTTAGGAAWGAPLAAFTPSQRLEIRQPQRVPGSDRNAACIGRIAGLAFAPAGRPLARRRDDRCVARTASGTVSSSRLGHRPSHRRRRPTQPCSGALAGAAPMSPLRLCFWLGVAVAAHVLVALFGVINRWLQVSAPALQVSFAVLRLAEPPPPPAPRRWTRRRHCRPCALL